MKYAFLFFFSFFMTTHVFADEIQRLLNETAAKYFSYSDWQLFFGTRDETLSRYQDGTRVAWKNPRSGHWGTMTPMNTTMNDGMRCRDVVFFNHIDDKRGKGTFTFCYTKGIWSPHPRS